MSLAWIRPHIFYLVLIGLGVVGIRAYMQEHDARLLADAKVTAANSQIAAIQETAAKQVRQVRTIVVQAKTPQQMVAAIPQLTNAPLNARIAPTLEAQPPAVTVDLKPLTFELLACKTCDIKLTECQQVSAQKDLEISALKKRPEFWHRVATTAKVVGIGVGIGLLIGGHL